MNNYGPKYNLVTLCMQMHKNSDILNEKERAKYEPMIKEGKFSYFFDFGTDVYMIMKELKTYSLTINRSKRIATIRVYYKSKPIAKYRTMPLSKSEIEVFENMTQDDIENFLRLKNLK